MFKKTTVTQAARPLNGKDFKVLRANLQAAFPNLRVDQVTADRPLTHRGRHPHAKTHGHAFAGTDVLQLLTFLPVTQLDELLPPKATVNITRLSNRSSVYSVANDVGAAFSPPLFFEMDYGGIYPTVYSLWRVPELCAVCIATYSEVSPKVRATLSCTNSAISIQRSMLCSVPTDPLRGGRRCTLL